MAKIRETDEYGLGMDRGRQLYLDLRQKTSFSAFNHLKAAEEAHYNELHGKYSVISLVMQDYSKGKGEKSLFTRFNVSPEELRIIFKWADTIYPLQLKTPHSNLEYVKLFNDNYSKLELIHNPKMKNCFGIKIINAKADGDKPIKDTVTTICQWYEGPKFYGMWASLYDRLKEWEIIHYSQLLKKMEPVTAKALAEGYSKGSSQENNQYSYDLPPLPPPPAFPQTQNYGVN